jgi:hypothetical protein
LTRAMAIAVGSLATLLTPPVASADLLYEPYGSWNGRKIYLSPARHEDAGARGECQQNRENDMAYYAAWDAANGVYFQDAYNPSSPNRNLRARGYKVRIGTGTLSSAISNSNAWGASRHVAIHSNADVAGQCWRTDASRFGTVGIYWSGSSAGYDLTVRLKDVIGVEWWGSYRSPGSNDYVCHNPGHPCTTITLGELRYTNAPAAYMETEFHTWNTGVNWLWNSPIWAWRFGRAIDLHLGYPR